MREMIYSRRSVRKYRSEELSQETVQKIEELTANVKPLYPEIKCKIVRCKREALRSIMPWLPKDALVFYSEEKPGYLENCGFIMQQLDLALQKMGLGTCWVGLAKPSASAQTPKECEGMKYMIAMSVGYTDVPMRKSTDEFTRLPVESICDTPDSRLEPARIAPSSTNSQPWYFAAEGDTFHVYYRQPSIIRIKWRSSMHYMDIGIALCHMYLTNPSSFIFFKTEAPAKDHPYVGSFKI